MRSAATPAKRASEKIGKSPRNESRPTQNGEPPSTSTSQLCASFCIHVPMLDVQAPDHIRRKSRDRKGSKALLNTFGFPPGGLRQRLRPVDRMQPIAVVFEAENETRLLYVPFGRMAEIGRGN